MPCFSWASDQSGVIIFTPKVNEIYSKWYKGFKIPQPICVLRSFFFRREFYLPSIIPANSLTIESDLLRNASKITSRKQILVHIDGLWWVFVFQHTCACLRFRKDAQLGVDQFTCACLLYKKDAQLKKDTPNDGTKTL